LQYLLLPHSLHSRYYVNHPRSKPKRRRLRLRLARGLLLALNFEIGSDILKTILVPLANELSILAVVVGIRIVLSWSLSKEIDRHNVDLLESGKQPIAGRKKAIFTGVMKNSQEEEESNPNSIDSKNSISEGEGGEE
jgi:Protein of unknown function (DUF1622)